MRTRRFELLGLSGAIAAVGVTAMLAGPASAQEVVEARTGEIHHDCEAFRVSVIEDVAELVAECRVSDDTLYRAPTEINLSGNIGVRGIALTWGWGSNNFQRSCESISVEHTSASVTLYATCVSADDEGPVALPTDRGQPVGGLESSLNLSKYYRVNAAGEFAVK